ncbi:coiled-coil domain-containing protein 77-like [Antedon mediterranea]|uniref:coiled-coil domain-containing protein 77-like n=1 Tax=Antedon mediterranea TaxID=105859 RepID=UPI003AF9A72C
MASSWNHDRRSDYLNSTPISNMNKSRSKSNGKNVSFRQVQSPALPTVNERLGYLRPSRELLEYYRRKIAEFDDEHEQMLNKLDEYKITYEQQHKMQWELKQREDEIAELQQALSDMQVFLFQEREHVLRLYSENDRLKIREIEDRKKIQHLLSLGTNGGPEVTYFHKEPPSKVVVPQRRPQSHHPYTSEGERLSLAGQLGATIKSRKDDYTIVASKSKGKSKGQTNQNSEGPDVEILALQVNALQAQLEEQTRASRDQISTLLDDRQVRADEMQTVTERDRHHIIKLEEKLHKTQSLLYDSTKDYLELKYQSRAVERDWMAEKDELLQELDRCKEELNVSKDDVVHVTHQVVESHQSYSDELEVMQNELDQAHKMADVYREQVIGLEDELARIREQDDVGREVFKERTEKMSKRLQLMNQRYQALEKRRNLEVEGFKTDVKRLRTRLKDVEKQLFKVTVGVGEDGDLRMLHDIHKTAKRSKKIQGELHNLKAKVYGLEDDLRRI